MDILQKQKKIQGHGTKRHFVHVSMTFASSDLTSHQGKYVKTASEVDAIVQLFSHRWKSICLGWLYVPICYTPNFTSIKLTLVTYSNWHLNLAFLTFHHNWWNVYIFFWKMSEIVCISSKPRSTIAICFVNWTISKSDRSPERSVVCLPVNKITWKVIDGF